MIGVFKKKRMWSRDSFDCPLKIYNALQVTNQFGLKFTKVLQESCTILHINLLFNGLKKGANYRTKPPHTKVTKLQYLWYNFFKECVEILLRNIDLSKCLNCFFHYFTSKYF